MGLLCAAAELRTKANRMEHPSVSKRPDIQFTSRIMADEARPFVRFSSDADGWSFRRTGTLQVPSMLNLIAGSEGAYSDLMVDIRSNFFADHHDAVWEVALLVNGEVVGRNLFWKWYGQHQVIIPLARFFSDLTVIEIAARSVSAEPGPDLSPTFVLEPLFCSKEHIWRVLEERSIWIFSTARSGSTWIAHDIIGWRDRARTVDESGIGRMFAPLAWDAERFFAIDRRIQAYESGLPYETSELTRLVPGVPPFERSFRDLGRELQILNHMNFDLFHRLLRDCALEHVLNEWGVRHYQKLAFKMPNDSHGADFIMRAFPRSRMVFLMRDGRDVMRSRFSPFASRDLAETTDPELRRYAIAFYAHFWNFEVDIMRSAYDAHNSNLRYFVRYEDMRTDPTTHIGRLLEALDMTVPPDDLTQLVKDATLENMPAETRGPTQARQTGQVGGYRSSFSPEEIELMNGIMRKNLQRYGYEVD
jgi:hypothetical protein